MEKLLRTEKGVERNKRLHRRRTFHGSTQQITPTRNLYGGILIKTPVNRACSVRKPLQVVSAPKVSSNSLFFSSTRKDKSTSVTKMFGTKVMEPVVKTKTPVAFTTPKPQGVSSSYLPRGETDIAEGDKSDDHQSCESLGSSSDDFNNDGEKPFMLQSLLSFRKSKKLDFITKDSKNVKTGGVKTNHGKMSSAPSAVLIARSSVPSSVITKSSSPSSASPKSASSVVAESAVKSIIAKSSPSLTNQSSSSSVATASTSSSSMITKTSTSSATMKSSLSSEVPEFSSSSMITTKSSISSSTIITNYSMSKRARVGENFNLETALDPAVQTNKVDEDASCKQSSIKQETVRSVHDDEEDGDFSNSVFAGNGVKRDSKALNRYQCASVSSGEKQNKNKGKPERKKLKVSRRPAGPSRKALQEARIQGLKNNIQDLEIGCSVSSTPSPPNAMEILPSSISETEIFCVQKHTPSSTGSIDKPKSENESPSTLSTTSSQGVESSTKTNKDWMHLFEEPFPRRSPRLSSLPSSTAKDYECLMENFSPLTSQTRARGRRKQSRKSNQEKKTKGDVNNQPVVSKEVKTPVSPLVLAEKGMSPPILQASAVEDKVKEKEESLKRLDKNILSKKKKSNDSLNQTEQNNSLVPSATSLHVSEDEMFHFPRPPAVLSSAGGPYNMIVDFALPDKDYAKLKLAKIKGNQARKNANKGCEVVPSKQDLNENSVTDEEKENESVKVDQERLTNSVESKVNIKETSIADEREMNAIPRDISNKNENEGNEKDTLFCEVDDDDGVIPSTPTTKTDQSITTNYKTDANLSEGTLTQYSDSENILSGSILQDLQVLSTVDKEGRPAVRQSLDDLDSSVCFENKHLDDTVSSGGLSKHGPELGGISLEKRSPKILKMSSHENESLDLQKNLDSKSNQIRGRTSFEEYENIVGSEMKENKKGTKCEKLPSGKECVPSSQGSSTSQSPNDLKGLLLLNGKMEKESHPISDSNYALSFMERQQGLLASSYTLDKSENPFNSISTEKLPGTVPSQNKMDVVQDLKKEDGQKIDDFLPHKHEDAKLVLGGMEMKKMCTDNEGLLNKGTCSLDHVNTVTNYVSNPDSKTVEMLPCRHENDIEMASAVNQITINQPNLDTTWSFSFGDNEMGSPVNQVTESHCGLDSVLLDTEMGSTNNKESQNSECVQTTDGNIKNPLHNITVPLCSNTEEFDDNTPGSIKGSVPLYSNPDECNEGPTDQDGSFPLCPDTEEFSCTAHADSPVNQNTQEFCIAESESLEPSIGDTATPHGKASVPQGSSMIDIEMGQTENTILTPVLMQACLQHNNSELDAVLSISMSTYDIPGHVVKKKDVIAVCLSNWVVLWIKMAGQEWTVLKSWSLDHMDSEMFQMVKFLPVISHLVLFVGGRFHSANGRVYGYSETTSYDLQLEYEDVDDWMSFSSICVLNDQQCDNSIDGNTELVIAGATSNGPVVTKWSLDCHCLDVKKHEALTLPDANGAITSLCTVDGNSYLLIGSTGTHLLLWNSKHCDLLKEINLSSPGLHNFDCLQAATEMGLLFLTMCQRSTTSKFESDAPSCLLYALNPLNNNFKCLQSFSSQELTSSSRCSSVCGQYLALGHQNGIASLVNMAAPQHSTTFPVFEGAIESISFHPSRPIMAFGGGKNACVHVYSLS